MPQIPYGAYVLDTCPALAHLSSPCKQINSQKPFIFQYSCQTLHFCINYNCTYGVGEENRQTLLNLGVLERLLKHIMSEDKIIRKNATMCLGTMSQNGE